MSGAISSVSSNSSVSAMRPEALEAPGRDVKNDHDSDDRAGSASAQSAPNPTVNTQGQILGVILNTKA